MTMTSPIRELRASGVRGTDQEEPATEAEELATSGAWQAFKSAPAKRAERLPPAAAAFAPPEHELDESSSDDEEVLPPD